MKKLISLTIGIISILAIGIRHVDAAPYKYHGFIYEGDKIDNIYYQNRDNTLTEAKIYKRSDSNNIIYSIEYDNKTEGADKDDYDDTFDYRKTKLTKNQTDRMNLIGYYGYNYKDDFYDHTDIKWYAITQYLIWKEEGNNNLEKIVDEKRNEIYHDEIKEMQEILEHHYLKPDFGERKFKTKIYDKLTIEDQNKVMNEYELMEINGANYKFYENKIDITTNKDDVYTLSFSKKDKRYNNSAIFYISEKYRNAMQIGRFESLTTNVIITSISGKVFVSKVGEQLIDYQNNEFIYKYQQVQGSTYHIYAKENIYNNIGELLYSQNEKVGELVLDEKDYFDNLYLADYYVKEVSSTHSYPIDGKSYNVHLDINNKSQTLSFSSKQPTVNISFKNYKQKVNYEDDKVQYNNIVVPGIEFGLFNSEDIYSNVNSVTPLIKKDTLLGTSTSNDYGIVKFNLDLPFGDYYIVNLTKDNNYNDNTEVLAFTHSNSSNTEEYCYSLSDYYQLLNAKNVAFSYSGENIDLNIYDENKNLIIRVNTAEDYSLSLPFGDYYYQVDGKKLISFAVNNNSTARFAIKKEVLDNKIPGPVPWGGGFKPSKDEEPKKDIIQNVFPTPPQKLENKEEESQKIEESKEEIKETDNKEDEDYKNLEELPKEEDKSNEPNHIDETLVEIDDNSFKEEIEDEINKKEEISNETSTSNGESIPTPPQKDHDDNIKDTKEDFENAKELEIEKPIDEPQTDNKKDDIIINETISSSDDIMQEEATDKTIISKDSIQKENNIKNMSTSLIESINTELNVNVPSTDRYDFIVYIYFIMVILLSYFYKNAKD